MIRVSIPSPPTVTVVLEDMTTQDLNDIIETLVENPGPSPAVTVVMRGLREARARLQMNTELAR